MSDLLGRIGKGLVSFGTGIPQIELDRAELQNQGAQIQNETGQFNLDQARGQVDAQAAQQAQMQELQAGMERGDEVSINRYLALFPEKGAQYLKATGLQTEQQLEDASRFAERLLSVKDPEQRDALIVERAQEVLDRRGDPKDTLSLRGMPMDQQDVSLKVTRAAALPALERLRSERGNADPAELTTFNALTDGLTEAERLAAKKVELGLLPRAGSVSATERIAEDGELTEAVAESQATIRARGKFAELEGASRAKAIDSGYEQVQKIDGNIRNLDKAIAAIDGGANTGVIANRFSPTIKAATIELQNLQKQLGIDVVGAVTFGALSKGELDLALDSAIPLDLQPADLRDWLVRKKDAQLKLQQYLREQMDFLDEGGTLAQFDRMKRRQGTNTDTPSEQQAGRLVIVNPDTGERMVLVDGQWVPE